MMLALLLAVELARWSTNGPRDAFTSDVAVAAGSHPRIFAIAYNAVDGSGIYRSEDGGSIWERAGPAPGGPFIELETDPHDPDRLFAATLVVGFSGVWTTLYRSLDGGASWTQRQQQHNGPLAGVAVLRSRVRRRRARHRLRVLREHFVDLSERRRGRDFHRLSVAILRCAARVRRRRHVDRGGGHDRSMSAATAARGGRRLRRRRCVCPIRAVAADPVDANRWYVGSGQALFACGEVARTDDGGVTWSLAADPGGSINDFATVASQPGWLYASTGGPEPSVAPGRVLATQGRRRNVDRPGRTRDRRARHHRAARRWESDLRDRPAPVFT